MQEQQSFTLDDMMDVYIENHVKKHNKSWRNLMYLYNHFFKLRGKHLLNRAANQVKPIELEYVHNEIGTKHGQISANKTISMIRAAYNKAETWGYFKETFKNPVAKITLFKEQSRDRFMEPNELQRFFKALFEEENTTIRDYVFISLMTGARKANVLAMRWKDVAFHSKLWRIPGEVMKNGSPLTVPLNNEAIAILEQRKAQQGSSHEYVFPSPESKTGHLVEPKKGWNRILKRAGITNLRIHDLRRTLGSYQAMSGVTTAVIGKTLGHKSQAATAVYERMNLDPVRIGIEKATSAMFIGSEELIKSYVNGEK